MAVKNTTMQNPEALTEDVIQRQAQAKLQRLIAEQGIKPLTLDALRQMGDLWPEDKNVDDFINEVRQWRSEGRERTLP